MNNQYNVWNRWGSLRTVMLGQCYYPEFFRKIKNKRIKDTLMTIADETHQDLERFETLLKDFGCQVLRPKIDVNDDILNYVDVNGRIAGTQGVPRSPLQPRDHQLVIGDKLFYTGTDHKSTG